MARHFMTRNQADSLDEPRVRAGAIVFVTTAEMTERGRPVDLGIKGLNRDVLNTLVYADPVKQREAAARSREDAKTFDVSAPWRASILRDIANSLDKEADILDARIKGKDPERLKQELAYSESFFTFRNSWDEFYFDVRNGNLGDKMSGPGISAAIDSYYSQYLGYVAKYKELGLTPSNPTPEPSKSGDTLPGVPDVNASVKGFFDAIPWWGIAAVGAVGIGGYVVYKVASAKKDEPVKETIVVATPAASTGAK